MSPPGAGILPPPRPPVTLPDRHLRVLLLQLLELALRLLLPLLGLLQLILLGLHLLLLPRHLQQGLHLRAHTHTQTHTVSASFIFMAKGIQSCNKSRSVLLSQG